MRLNLAGRHSRGATGTWTTGLTERESQLPARAGVVVIGGGAIGLATASALMQRGADVVVLERGAIGTGASFGNGGLVPPSHSLPLTMPGTMGKALRWMFDPSSPFYIAPRADPTLARFLLRFAWSCRRQHLTRAVPAMRDLNLLSISSIDQALASLGDVGYRRDGVINVYRSDAGFQSGQRDAALLAEYGLRSHVLVQEELREAEPLLADPFAGGVLWPDDGHVDPQRLSAALARSIQDRGGRILEGVEVHEIVERRPDPLLRTSHGTIAASSVVIVAGSWSARLARSVGAAFPLQPAKGYSVTVERPEGTLRRPLLLSEAKVAATPFDGSLRLAGTLELTGFDQTLSERRVDAVLGAGRSYIPRAANGKALCAWTGLRALSGDGIPIIGRLANAPSVAVATGHGHAGIGMSFGTATLVSALVEGADPPIDPRPYAPDRFRW